MHRECVMRSILGSVSHQTRMCSCHGGSAEDSPNPTVRDSARLAVIEFMRQSGRSCPFRRWPLEERVKLRPSNYSSMDSSVQRAFDSVLGLID
jgi:hypothetical protein